MRPKYKYLIKNLDFTTPPTPRHRRSLGDYVKLYTSDTCFKREYKLYIIFNTELQQYIVWPLHFSKLVLRWRKSLAPSGFRLRGEEMAVV